MVILCMGSANERRHYNVMPSLIGWAHAENDPWIYFCWSDNIVQNDQRDIASYYGASRVRVRKHLD